MARCKECIHSDLCKDMHRFGIVDLPYDDDRAACDHFKDSAGVVELPCKVGDTVWFLRQTGYKEELLQTTVEKIVLKSRGLHLKLACNAMYETSCNSIGKTVFLTREEAEKAIAERKQHDQNRTHRSLQLRGRNPWDAKSPQQLGQIRQRMEIHRVHIQRRTRHA